MEMTRTHTQPITKERYLSVRNQSEKLCAPLATEDHVAQPTVEVSPPRWHLAHVTWFFENFVLTPYLPDYKPFHEKFHYLFNSYYVQAGERWQREARGYLTRPTVEEIMAYRKYVDEHMVKFLEDRKEDQELEYVLELGLQHEQQHQELLLYDIKYILGHNPLFPPYQQAAEPQHNSVPFDWLRVTSGNYEVGFQGDGFCFDNEKGFHTVFLHDFEIANRLVTKGEYLEFMRDGGYERAPLWLDEGWNWVKENHIKAPMYWHPVEHNWFEYTLGGEEVIRPEDPLAHVSFYEADAYARWKGYRLPTEQEWEIACKKWQTQTAEVNFVEQENYKAIQLPGLDFLGNLWEWTSSAYRPYPFYRPDKGVIGEYNGKFMVNQIVLRGGSYATPQNHIRTTYRNFFHPHLRWMFSGIRLAKYI